MPVLPPALRRVCLVLRVSLAACWIGHGAFGLIGKAGWLPYFAACGIGPAAAWKTMPVVGTMDILLGIVTLLWPVRAVWCWAVVWTAFTALLRPLAHQGWSEFFERAGNFGPPVALLLIAAGRESQVGPWFRAAVASLLAGHAGCGLLEHSPGLLHNIGSVFPSYPAGALTWVAVIDLALAAAVLAKPSAALLVAICAWKVATEALYPLSGLPIWEFLERAGSYGLPLAYALFLRAPRTEPPSAAAVSAYP